MIIVVNWIETTYKYVEATWQKKRRILIINDLSITAGQGLNQH